MTVSSVLATLLVAGGLLGSAAWAQSAGSAWHELSPSQRSALAPLQQEWPSIDATRRAKWIAIANRFPAMKAEEQVRVQGRMAEWARLSPAERGRARATFQDAKQVPSADRQAQWEAYQALPAEKRRELAVDERRSGSVRQSLVAPSQGAKRNIVGNPALLAPAPKAVGPTVIQAGPGATTKLITKQGLPPSHQQPGLPKVAAPQGFVDRETLLPKRGAQGAATRPTPGASAPRGRP